MKIRFILTLVGLMSSSALSANQPQSNTTVTSEVTPTKSLPNKSIEISLGYFKSDLKSKNPQRTTFIGDGITISLSKFFILVNNFTTSSSLMGNYTFVDEKKSSEGDTGSDITSYDVGISQRFAYNISTKAMIVSPFLDVGFFRGKMMTNYTQKSENYTYEFNTDVMYNRYGVSLGVQFILPNGLTPFIKYTFSKIRSDRTGKEYSRTTTSTLSTLVYEEEYAIKHRDFNSTILYAGIGYLF